ncbi:MULTISPECIES: hypothetical protein [Pseudoalteromonas]|uniref:hypothetical protein n=1 Tax=Pseudoalteromonas TaxID=53246 RepID=UPI001582E1C3|nr:MULTISPECIES: hypothetical protein [Pseudoalteromonas]MDI4653803.1 hypothetical protein [Pseudoalteromonas shioyasakiensis]NUJ40013.1 hypothetical protein [Pseudoalteromonas sp. 0303]
MEQFITPMIVKTNSQEDYHSVRPLFRNKYINASFSFISQNDGLSTVEKKAVLKEIWQLLQYLTAPEDHTWVEKTRVWQNASYREFLLNAYYVKRPESKEQVELHIEKRLSRLKASYCRACSEPLPAAIDDLPPLEPLADL